MILPRTRARNIAFDLERCGAGERVEIHVRDTGPGIPADNDR